MFLSPLRAAVVIAVGCAAPAGLRAAPPTDDPLKAAALKLNDVDATDDVRPKAVELLKDKDAAKKLVGAAVKLQKSSDGKKPPFNFNAGMVLGLTSLGLKDFDSAETFLKYCVEASGKPKEKDRPKKMLLAYEGLMDLYWEQKDYTAVDETAQKYLEAQNDVTFPYLLVMEMQAKARAKNGDTDKALEIVDQLTRKELDKIGTYFIQTRGWVYREAGKNKEALAAYQEYLDKLDDLKELISDKDELTRMKRNTRYLMTGIYVDQDNVDQAADVLKALIKEDPDNPTFYNDLGFIWADHDKNMDESEKLIRKALELDVKQRKKLLDEGKIGKDVAAEENAAYLDSLGWVLFKNKKYEEAKKYLELASKDKDERQHIEIWDHLADCLVALGQKKEAVAMWTKALKFDDVSKRDVERRKKVTEKLKKLKAELAAK